MIHDQYFVGPKGGPEVEVPKWLYVQTERAAGFRNSLGHRDEPATAAFSSGTYQGRIKYRICRAEEQTYAGQEVDHSGCFPVD